MVCLLNTTSLQIFKGRLPQISLASFLNALCYIHLFLFSTFKETWKLDDSDLQQAAEWIIQTLIKSFHFGFHFFIFASHFSKPDYSPYFERHWSFLLEKISLTCM